MGHYSFRGRRSHALVGQLYQLNHLFYQPLPGRRLAFHQVPKADIKLIISSYLQIAINVALQGSDWAEQMHSGCFCRGMGKGVKGFQDQRSLDIGLGQNFRQEGGIWKE